MNALRLYTSLAGGLVVAGCAAAYWIRSHRKSAEQREFERRALIATRGRITDGTVLDLHELPGEAPVHLLMYRYKVAGVSYECSQDITNLRQYVSMESCRIGLPTSVKYDPHNPANSIVVAEGWTGLRR